MFDNRVQTSTKVIEQALQLNPFCRSRSKDKKQKKKSGLEERSGSLESGCSEHNYETPKLLQKSPKTSPPQVLTLCH